jgi:hypothetical protein
MKDKLVYAVTGFFVGNFFLGLVAFGIFLYYQEPDSLKEITFEELTVLHSSGAVRKLRFEQSRIVVSTREGQVFLRQELDDELGRGKVYELAARGPSVDIELASQNISASTFLLLQLAPIIGIAGLFVIIVLLIVIVFRLKPTSVG